MEALLLKFVEGISSQLGASSVSFLQFMCCFNFGDEKTKIESRLSTTRALLLDADEQQDHTHIEKDLIENLQLTLYEAEDLVEEIRLYETADVERRNILCRSFKTTIPFHILMPLKLKAINERLAKFIPEGAGLPQPPQRSSDGGHRNTTEPQCFRRSADIIGREKDKKAIKNMLKESSMSSDGSNVPIIIPIIGMGGLGKTTLARSVYEDVKDDAEGFKLKMWVWVSQDFDVEKLLIKVIKAATGEKCEQSEMIELDSKLRECLDGNKYLLVLDDIWNTDPVKWADLESFLKGGAKGSAILATTREVNVASTMRADPKYQYRLEDLDEDACWSLFERQLEFKIDQMEEKQIFVAIGKKILNKCGGNPLAIKVVGGLLCSTDRKKWQNIENDKLWSQAQEGNILPALKVSYARLPYHLKKCFAYCSLFPRGDEIKKTELTQLWFAQGFVDQHSNNGLLADSADECFSELRNRSFLQDEKNDEYGDVTSCKLHDLMYDLAQKAAGSECVIVDHDKVPDISERTIHASVKAFNNEETRCVDGLIRNGILPTKVRNLRTLLTSCNYREGSKQVFCTTFKRLRMLKLEHISRDNPNVLKSLSKLIHLRYLDLSWSNFTMLPNSICKLRYLQTLKLNHCSLKELPGDITKLTNLIHLENTGCSLKGMPLGIGQMTSIRTLSEFVLGVEGWAGLSELEGLNNLSGSLKIEDLHNYHNATNAISESRKAFYLKDKKNLRKLELNWDAYTFRDEDSDKDVALLESLQPNPNLTHLKINWYFGVKFPSWMEKSLPNLVEIHLEDCPSCECLPLFVDQLRSLKRLSLYYLTKLKYIRSYVSDISYPPTSSSSPFNSNILSGAAGFFPALKEVSLKSLPKLKEWSIEVIVGDAGGKPKTDSAAATQPKWLLSLNTLSTLAIQQCRKLTSMPSFPNIEELKLDDISGALIQSMTRAEIIWPTTSSLPSFLTLSKLKSLEIANCKVLVSLPQGWLENFTSLERLQIRYCARLESLSRETPHMPKDLKGKALDFPEEEEDDLQSCRKLRSLKLENLPKLSSLPKGLQHATKLELHIHSCDGLVNWGNITSLHSLDIRGFQTLTSLPQGLRRLTALENLEIRDCPELNFSDEDNNIPVLTTLLSLKISGLPKLASLPELLLHTTALKNLKIVECPGLVCLPDWLGNVTSLQQLKISRCYELKSIPETMRCLTALQKLTISNCPRLPETHHNNEVPSKIAHIQEILIDGEY